MSRVGALRIAEFTLLFTIINAKAIYIGFTD